MSDLLGRPDRIQRRHNRNGRGPCGCHHCETADSPTPGELRAREKRKWRADIDPDPRLPSWRAAAENA